ncbi:MULTISPECIES: tryptophan--tRNA ligase [unclassified Haloferax]|uniref:tryptophan--tRNA ligase n=1 Tax=unclassified Haloferax TaxID=2625095 RepID=UPI0002B20DD2|nr:MULTISPECIES: tryptophan--tRNA ligase [unclassified Haloferax]ELZ57388.1 tryptophanyl-tRNA ligase [Haloferax sp. ATCC BAA-646]ELZ62352.1 tryptophanyl-tRNA ligase [Haloferax sp. ATCC BAA-645]ELZ65391.1 tryptophanyl-tRNA ligase [Haloferax sp. ATCC BAA-644]
MTDDEPAERIRTDGGTAEGADDVALDPWGSSTVSDYRKLFEEFGIEEFDEVLDEVPNPHYLMRRGVIFGHRDYRPVLDAMRNGDDFAVLSGFMPTGDPHIGHKLVFDEIIWHQQQGGDAYGLIADMEAHSARGIPWDEINEHSRDYLLSLIALGFDPEAGELYRQSDNDRLQRLAFELGGKANFSEFQSIYGFDGETNVSHMQSVVTQMADILYPQLDDPKPTVIPVGPDQDPHVRFARDLATRMRFFKVTEAFASFELDDAERPLVAAAHDAREEYAEDADTPRCGEAADWLDDADLDAAGVLVSESVRDSAVEKLENAGMEPLRPRIRFFARQATDEAFEALIEDIEGEKRRYDQHIDAFDIGVDEAEELAREVEAHHGGYGFIPPSSIYHRFMTGLTGGKMSSSIPASHISLLDAPEEGYDKVKSATTGGRDTAEQQRELGGEADKCPVYELYAYLLTGDDDDLAKEVYDECVGGERLCGGCKEQAATMMREFLEDHHEKREEAEELLDSLDIDLETERRGVAAEH